MQNISVSLTTVVFLALIALLVAAVTVPVEIVDTVQNVNAVPFSGTIMVIQEMPNLSFATYEDETSSASSTSVAYSPIIVRRYFCGADSEERKKQE